MSSLTSDSDYSLLSFGYAALIDVGCASVLVLIFWMYRSNSKYDWALATRLVRGPPKEPPDPWKRPLPPPLPRNPISITRLMLWGIPTHHDELIAGLDATIMLRFFRISLKFFSFAMVVGLAVILQINISGDEDTSYWNQLSMASLEDGSPLTWFHCMSVFLYSIYLMYLLYTEFEAWAVLRHKYHLTSGIRGNTTSVMITNIPPTLRDDGAFAEFFRALYPNDYKSSFVVKRTPELDKLVKNREKLVWKLDRQLFMYQKQVWEMDESTPRNKKLRELDQTKQDIRDLNLSIEELQKQPQQSSEIGFLTFHTYSATVLALSTVKKVTPYTMQAYPACEPVEIHWKNIQFSKTEANARWIIWWILILVLIAFYMIPISILSAFTTLDTLYSLFPELESWLSNYSVLEAFIEGWAPAAVLALFNLVLPEILRFMIIEKGDNTESKMDMSLFGIYYFYQMVAFFIVTLMTSSLINVLEDLVSSPISLLQMLAEYLPDYSAYFCNYIMIYIFIVWPWRFIRLWPVMKRWLMKLFWAKTPKEVSFAEHPGWVRYGRDLPNLMIIFTLGLTYSTISPLILVFAFVYFLVGLVVTRHQLLYVFTPVFESGGQFFPRVFSRMVIGMLLYQTFMVGYFLYKSCYYQAIALIPLMVATCIYHFYVKEGFVNIANSPTQEEVTRFDSLVKSLREQQEKARHSHTVGEPSQSRVVVGGGIEDDLPEDSSFVSPSLSAEPINVDDASYQLDAYNVGTSFSHI
jgi:hypothetical protein